jgi:allantoate deiminase
MRDVHRVLGEWMRGIGMRVRVDAAGNLRGVLGDAARRLVIGSHLDTIPDAGAFDGILGVVLGIALAEVSGALRNISLEIIGFSEEEGVRFGKPFIGSRAFVGTLDETLLDAGVADAIRAFGLDPAQLPRARFDPATAAYLEFHIEQGPVLESFGLPLGVVDGIVGQSRLRVTFTGQANHAGTTPMPLRRDALAAAAEWIARVEALALNRQGLTATVGAIAAEPNAGNVIAGKVTVSLDVRHAVDAVRHSSVADLLNAADEIGARRSVGVASEPQLDQAAVAMDTSLGEMLARAVAGAGFPVHHMMSGAGHDAMIVAPHIPSAMLFLRSPGGLSHHPDESVLAEDVDAALQAGLRFIASLEAAHV